MSNFSYFASRTPSATFSKSQNSAMLMLSGEEAMEISVSDEPPMLSPRRGTCHPMYHRGLSLPGAACAPNCPMLETPDWIQ